ncbi:MAG: adenine deaminase [Phycisphaerales bacterium]|jgi:adenine deaminase|nr:adenine deaminase [Phycisphaerales bacterium]
MSTVDVLLQGAQVVDVNTRSIIFKEIGILNGAFTFDITKAKKVIHCDGLYIAPGLIDAHMHVESTMLPPSGFCNLAAPHGTTAVVLDPHEIANVLGILGIKRIMEDAKGLPLDCFFAASSCVPASPLETSGATLLADDLEPLFQDDRMVALAEMMNFPGVIHEDPEVQKKIQMALRHGKKVDGHCPSLRGEALKKYVDAGISSDHESTSADEALEKLKLGMQLYIREGSAAKNLEALAPIITPENAHQVCFCTDDRHPADLRDEGHIDNIIRKAVTLGIDPVLAICIASKHAADHYNLQSHGSIDEGKFANFIVFDDLHNFEIKQTWHHGTLIAEAGEILTPEISTTNWESAKGSVHLPKNLDEATFSLQATADTIRVIELIQGQLLTNELRRTPLVKNEAYVADPSRDILKMAVIERHHNTGNIGLGFVRGFAFSGGAIASTVGHDAHNVAVIGDNDGDMALAAKTLAPDGGLCVVANGEVLAQLPLPIAGLMSDALGSEVIEQQRAVLHAVHSLGCPLEDPFMPLSFLPLSVIPKLKLSDLGLVDVEQFAIVPLEVSDAR